MEINLLQNYPKTHRDLKERGLTKTEEQKKIARKFDFDFFDGDRKYGYGGFNYDKKYWSKVVKDFINFYGIQRGDKILDVGCGKGFMLFDFQLANLDLELYGIDISNYALNNSKNSLKAHLVQGNAKELPFESNYFDLVISINTIHNLVLEDCKKSIQEIMRVSKKNSFLVVDAYRNKQEKENIYAWNLTAQTILSTDEWKELFLSLDYKGDYYWFIP